MKIKSLACLLLIAALAVLGSCKRLYQTGPDEPEPDGPEPEVQEFSGLVTLDGNPLADVTVYLSYGASQSVTTGIDGKFIFKNLGNGSYYITPSKVGFAFTPSRFELSSNLTRKDLNVAAALASYGTTENSIAVDFSARNQGNAMVTLSGFHGKVILLDFTADWCGPCREKAQTAEAFYQQYKDRGFMYILVVIEGSPKVWADTYGLTFPVLDDNSQAIFNFYRTSGGLPLPHVIDRNMTIRYKKEYWNKSEVEDLINKLF